MSIEFYSFELERVQRLPKPSSHYLKFLRYQIQRPPCDRAPDGPLLDKASDLNALLHPEDHFRAHGSEEKYKAQRAMLQRVMAEPSNGETELAYWDFRIRTLALARQNATDGPNASLTSKYTLHAIQERLAFHGVISRDDLASVQQHHHAVSHAAQSASCRLDWASGWNPPQDTSQLQDPSCHSPPRLPPAEVQVHRHDSPRVLGPAQLVPGATQGPQTTAEKQRSGPQAGTEAASGGLPAASAAPPKVNRPTAAPGLPNNAWLSKPAAAKLPLGVSRSAAPRMRRGGFQAAAAAARADVRPPVQPSIPAPVAGAAPATAPPPPADEIDRTSGEGAANGEATSRQPSSLPKGPAAHRRGEPKGGPGGHPTASGCPKKGEAPPRKTVKRGQAKVYDVPDGSGSDEEGQGEKVDPMGVRPSSRLCAVMGV